MKVTGLTIIRNAVKLDYPVLESIRSALPLCDEFIVSVGNSEDDTRELVASLNDPRIRIVDSVWDDSLRKGGKVLAAETNKALDLVGRDTTWCLYIQADEVLHEADHGRIREAMQQHRENVRVEGLLFDYLHFYGSYDYIGDSRSWYRREVRIIRNDPAIRSFRDAQGFQKNGRPLKVMSSGGRVFHYGWVRPPKAQQEKQKSFHKLWHDDNWVEQHVSGEEFDYSGISHLKEFKGKHPEVMKSRIMARNWTFTYDPAARHFGIRNTLLHWIEKQTGWRIGEYRNYRKL